MANLTRQVRLRRKRSDPKFKGAKVGKESLYAQAVKRAFGGTR